MWLMTDIGFFSVVQKPGDKGLTVRTRVRADLDALRERYLPELGPTIEHAGIDYRFRAKTTHAALAKAAGKIIQDIHYPNFKSQVVKQQGHARGDAYMKVWSALQDMADDQAEQPAAKPKGGKKPQPASDAGSKGKSHSYGGVVFNSQGRVLLRRPSGNYDGDGWTFPKGHGEPGETPEQTASREVFEETGLTVKLLQKVPDSFEGTTTVNEYWVMEASGEAQSHGWETESIQWVTLENAVELISEKPAGLKRARDLAVLKAAVEVRAPQSLGRIFHKFT